MTLIQCSECNHPISKKAKTCPHCGVKNKRTSPLTKGVLIFLGIIIVLSMFSEPSSTSSQHSTTHSSVMDQKAAFDKKAEPTKPLLETHAWRCSTKHGYMIVQGEVKNISNQSIENLMAVGVFRTKDGDFIKSDEALIKYNPILPGQTSPFKVMTSGNPKASKCSVSFKEMFGGKVMHNDLRKE